MNKIRPNDQVTTDQLLAESILGKRQALRIYQTLLGKVSSSSFLSKPFAIEISHRLEFVFKFNDKPSSRCHLCERTLVQSMFIFDCFIQNPHPLHLTIFNRQLPLWSKRICDYGTRYSETECTSKVRGSCPRCRNIIQKPRLKKDNVIWFLVTILALYPGDQILLALGRKLCVQTDPEIYPELYYED